MTTSITLRSVKGTPLTHNEVDDNFTNLKTTADAAAADASTAVNAKANASAVGITSGASNMGTYTGSTIPDNETAKQNIQSLETAVETKANASAVGVSSSAANMGTYTGSTISDNQTAKQNIQELETATEARPTSATLAASGGSSLIGFIQSGTGAVARTVQAKLRELFSIADHSTPSQAAQAPTANINTGSSYSSMPQSAAAQVIVPGGSYTPTDYIDTSGRHVTWMTEQGAVLNNPFYFLGKIVRPDRVTYSYPSGILDKANGFSISIGSGKSDAPPLINGITNPNQISINSTIDLVAFYADVQSMPLLLDGPTSGVTATFSATSVVLSSAVNTKLLRVGMVIQTTHATWWRGQITSWSADGLTINVQAWYQNGSSVAGTPANDGSTVLINPYHKVWSVNTNVFLGSDGYAYQATGYELGLTNNKVAPSSAEDSSGSVWGFDAVTLSGHKVSIGHLARGSMFEGFRATGTDIGFNAAAFSSLGYAVPGVGYNYDGAGTAFRQRTAAGVTQFSLSGGAIELGTQGASNTPFIDFHSGATNVDYDARIIASGGTGSTGGGQLDIAAATIKLNGTTVLRPTASVTPASNGDMSFELTSNTELKIKVKGSDGTVRSVSLTLA